MAEHPEPTTPPQPETPATESEPVAAHRPVRHLELKATVLLLFTLALVTASALYLLYARGFFEPKQSVILITDNAEGVVPGMDLLFSGFPIGRVHKVALGDSGDVRITVDVNRKDAKWLRTSSVFTLVRGLVGEAQLRAYSGVLGDPPLPDGAERPVLRGDTNSEIQRVIGAARDLLDNLNDMTSQNSELQRIIGNLQVFTNKLQSRRGALHAVFGNEEDAKKLVAAVERANSAMKGVEELAAHADRQVFGKDGLATDARATVRQMNALLADARTSLKKVDSVLAEAEGAAAGIKTGAADLGSLRTEVETNLRKIEDLINDLNRKWPFAKERKVELP
ncbi:MAG: MCE family protein [Burkholderiales bacterium]|nr:MCE family protein [Burkholderiales bacterium]